MDKNKRFITRRREESIDSHEIKELIEMGLGQEEISRELNLPKEYIGEILNEYYKDY